MEKFEPTPLTERKTFQKEFKTDKNNTYLINFTSSDSLEIKANNLNNIIKKSFSNKFSFREITENRYFLQFDSLNEIFDELNERVNNSKIIIEENENNIKIKIPLLSSKNKEILFELKEKNKNDNEKINDLTQLVIKQNKEITDLKNENIQLKNEINDLKNEINNMNEKLIILWKAKEEKEKEKEEKKNFII